MSLLTPGALEWQAELVKREVDQLVARADVIRERIDACQASDDAAGVQLNMHRLAWIARRLTRAQAILVHPDDDRHAAALAVIGYCDEADEKERPWGEPVRVQGLNEAA